MTVRPRGSHWLVALSAVGLCTGCGAGVIPGLLPTWAADTLGPADIELPRPAGPGRTGTAATSPRPAESVLAPVEDPRGYDAEAEAIAWVEMELKDRGLRFGTDGTVRSLLEYVRSRHGVVAPSQTRAGDVVFFDLSGHGGCGDHAGVVDAIDAGGRIAFRESRGGVVRLSYAHPGQPALRRAVDGRVLNTFLRIRRADDPPGSRYLAGALLCAVGRAPASAPGRRIGSWERPGARRAQARSGSGR